MAEELQFYYQVMRKFQSIFQNQETDITFYTYDKMPEVCTCRTPSCFCNGSE